jgi:hypothetical protein
MSMIKNPPPDFLSLPNELLAKICVYAADKEPCTRGKKWLRAVRLTCKQLYTPATKELAKSFLRSPAVMISTHSLQELVALCKHELIGPYVQEIVFYPCSLSNKYLGEIQVQTASLITKGDFEGVATIKRHVEWYFTRLEDEIHLEKSGDAKMLLQQAFGAVRRPIKLTATTSNLSNILFTHSEWRDSRPRIEEFISFSKIAYHHGGGSMSILTVFEAAIAAGSQIHAFKVSMDTESTQPVYLSEELAQALSRLERLEIDIGPSPITRTEKTLVAIISNARGLLQVVYSSNPEYVKKSWSLAWHISRQARVLSSHALRQRWMREVVVHSRSLVMMLRKHRNTLKELTIFNVLLLGPWDRILLVIRDELRLDKLVWINLSAANEDDFMSNAETAPVTTSIHGGVELNGHEKLISGIDGVLSKWNRQRSDPDYVPSWRSVTDMGRLAYPEN